jgi:hypothetical protein
MHFYMHSYLHKNFILVKSGCYSFGPHQSLDGDGPHQSLDGDRVSALSNNSAAMIEDRGR